MDSLLTWWSDLDRAQQFDLTKIFIDKGLLALLIVFAGLLSKRYLESYKSARSYLVELDKFTIPRVCDLMNDADKLHQLALKTLVQLSDSYRTEWEPWLDRLIANPKGPKEFLVPSPVSVGVGLDWELESGQTLREHIICNTPNYFIRRLIEQIPPNEQAQSRFLSVLLDYYGSQTKVDPETGCEARTSGSVRGRDIVKAVFFQEFFKYVTTEQRNTFRKEADAFVIKAKNVIPLHKSKSLDYCLTCVETIRH
jgi:hypothetical protein